MSALIAILMKTFGPLVCAAVSYPVVSLKRQAGAQTQSARATLAVPLHS